MPPKGMDIYFMLTSFGKSIGLSKTTSPKPTSSPLGTKVETKFRKIIWMRILKMIWKKN
jgi:hypothetical protein